MIAKMLRPLTYAIVTMLFALPFGATLAQDVPADSPGEPVEVPMYEYLEPSDDGGVTTQGTVTGNCGSVSLDVGDAVDGNADFIVRVFAATPNYGPIISVDYYVTWVNQDTEGQGTAPDSTLVGADRFLGGPEAFTDFGFVNATLYGSAQVFRGGQPTTCYFGNPSAYATIRLRSG